MTIFRKIFGSNGSGKEQTSGKTCPVCGQSNPLKVKFCSSCGNEFVVVCDYFDAFISYRRESGSDLASLLRLQLENRYHKRTFLDVNELQVGRFDDALLLRIEVTHNFIVILSRGSLDRCVNKSDWLKREIMQAIKSKCNIIPVMTDNFAFPSDEIWALLPPEMRILSSLNGIIYSHIHQDSAIRKIASYMKDGTKTVPSDTTVPKTPADEKPTKPKTEQLPTPEKSPDKKSSTQIKPASGPVIIHPTTTTKTDSSFFIFSKSDIRNKTIFPGYNPRLGELKLEILKVVKATGPNSNKPTIGSASLCVNGTTNLIESNFSKPFFSQISIITNPNS